MPRIICCQYLAVRWCNDVPLECY